MENATKALMIAGALLIAVLLVTVGMSVFNMGSDMIDRNKTGMEQTEINQFNNKFLAYEGEQKGSKIKGLISEIITMNATNAGIYDDRVVSFNGKTTSTDLTGERTALVSGKIYTIALEYNAGGLITTITCTEKK